MVSSSLLEEILNVCLNSANAQYMIHAHVIMGASESSARRQARARERGHYEARGSHA